MGNLTNVNYAASPDVSFSYDALNRTTNMIDAIGTSRYTYVGCCSSQGAEDGPWDSDTLTYSYTSNNFRATLSLALPGSAPWQHTHTYDLASRLKTIASPAGTFSYDYSGASQLIQQLNLPNGTWITNTYDNMARLTNTWLRPNTWSGLNQHVYAYNVGNQRTKHTRTGGDYVDYTYDNIGQLKTATGKESGGSARLNEKYGYSYDAAGNLYQRTNNALTQTFNVNNLNQLTTAGRSGTLTVAGTSSSSATSVTVNGSAATRYADYTFAKHGVSLSDGTNSFTATAQDSLGRSDSTTNTVYLPATVNFAYDSNGNLLSDGRRGFEYDDENQLVRVTVTNAWKSEFSYDGKQRRRLRKEFTWQNSAWAQTAEVRYVYDGMLVIQERDGNNLPLVTYTRGLDLGGGLQAAGGIGGLLARTDNGALATQPSSAHAFYHGDGSGNVTMLVSQQKAVVAHYVYDPYGNLISSRGSLADVNLYRFSSKETHTASGLVYFGFRYYDANLQRFVNRDPLHEHADLNLHRFAQNSAVNFVDPWGLDEKENEIPPGVRIEGDGWFTQGWTGWMGPDGVGKLGFCPDSLMQETYRLVYKGIGAPAPAGGGSGGGPRRGIKSKLRALVGPVAPTVSRTLCGCVRQAAVQAAAYTPQVAVAGAAGLICYAGLTMETTPAHYTPIIDVNRPPSFIDDPKKPGTRTCDFAKEEDGPTEDSKTCWYDCGGGALQPAYFPKGTQCPKEQEFPNSIFY